MQVKDFSTALDKKVIDPNTGKIWVCKGYLNGIVHLCTQRTGIGESFQVSASWEDFQQWEVVKSERVTVKKEDLIRGR